jgi:formylmethanofuran dehydrogenase subunit C
MLVLKYRGSTTIPVEAECITPDALAGKSPQEIEQIPVQHGNREEPLAEFFQVAGDASDGCITVEGDCSRVKLIGTGMTFGTLRIEGHVGMHLGAEMSGGEIHVHGNAGDWVGAEIRGGLIYVHGDAGHLVGAGYRGSRRGMRGGSILIDGKAGNEIGSVMRRGLIAIGGDAGDFAGVSMIAGSIFLFGQPGIRIGAGMKRGTLVLLSAMSALLPTFRYACKYRPLFMDLYLHQLRQWQFPGVESFLGGEFHRYCGDLVSLGKGEILHRAS